MRGVFLIPGIVILFIALMVATMPRKQKPMTVAEYKQCLVDAEDRAKVSLYDICGETRFFSCYALAPEDEKELILAVVKGLYENKDNCLKEFANRR